MTQIEAETLLNKLATVDDGNEIVLTDIFTKFLEIYPEHRSAVEKIFQRIVYRPFEVYKGD